MRPLPILAALLTLAAGASGQEPVEFRIKLLKDASWKVEQTIDFKSAMSDRISKTTGDQPLVKGTWKLTEAWTDLCTLDKEGRPMSVRRTVTASKCGGPAAKPEATSLEGAVVTVEEKEKDLNSRTASVKGKPAQASLDVLAKGPVDSVSFLFPDHPVKPGEEWKVIPHWVCLFQRVACAGIPGLPTFRLSEFAKLMEYLKSHGQSPQGCEITGKVSQVEKGEALVEFAGKSDDGVATVDIKATLKWNVARGRPVSLEWNQARSVKANADAGTAGFNEEWKIVKSWK
ncbi:MAG: hypothetical protein HYY18_23010 [Planctomycetes bacterium]|nr:hypothetical protein [Planctomycetota bacterium]